MKTIYNYTQKTAAVMNASLKVEIFLSDAKENAGIAALCRGFMTKSDEKRSLLAWRAYSRCFLKKKTPTSSKGGVHNKKIYCTPKKTYSSYPASGNQSNFLTQVQATSSRWKPAPVSAHKR